MCETGNGKRLWKCKENVLNKKAKQEGQSSGHERRGEKRTLSVRREGMGSASWNGSSSKGCLDKRQHPKKKRTLWCKKNGCNQAAWGSFLSPSRPRAKHRLQNNALCSGGCLLSTNKDQGPDSNLFLPRRMNRHYERPWTYQIKVLEFLTILAGSIWFRIVIRLGGRR